MKDLEVLEALRRRIKLAVWLVAFLAVGIQAYLVGFIAQRIGDETVSGLLVNNAGRQRMLSQRLVKLSFMSQFYPQKADSLRLRMQNWQQIWYKHQQALSLRAADSLVGENTPATKALYLAQEPHFTKLMAAFSTIAQAKIADKAVVPAVLAALDTIAAHEYKYLTLQEQITHQYAMESEANLQAIQRSIYWAIGIAVLTSLVLLFVVARPAYRDLEGLVQELADKDLRLETKNHLLSEKNDELHGSNLSLKAAMEELEATMQHLHDTQEELVRAEKMAGLGRLVAGISHELNSPLGAIKASVGTLTDSLTHYRSNFFKFYDSLSEPERAYYHLLSASLKPPAIADAPSSRELRQLKGELTHQLEQQQLEPANLIAGQFVECGITDLAQLPDFRHLPMASRIFQQVAELLSIRMNMANIDTAVDRTTKMMRSLQLLSGESKPQTRLPIDLHASLEGALGTFGTYLGPDKVVVQRAYAPGTLQVLADAGSLEMIWTQLILNALQAMAYKGTLGISTLREASRVHIIIQDTGPGIPWELQDQLFRPFFTTKGKGEAVGIGLYLCRQLAAELGGSIQLSSDAGGTTVRLSLPLVVDADTGCVG